MFKRFITGWLCIVGMVLYALLLGLQHGCRRIIGIPGTLRSEPVSTNTLTTRHRLKASHTAPKNQSTHTQTARHTSQRSLEPSTSRSARKLPYNIHAAHEATGSHRHTIERQRDQFTELKKNDENTSWMPTTTAVNATSAELVNGTAPNPLRTQSTISQLAYTPPAANAMTPAVAPAQALHTE